MCGGEADNLVDVGVGEQCLFDLKGRDDLATTIDDFFRPTVDVEVLVLVKIAEVSV